MRSRFTIRMSAVVVICLLKASTAHAQFALPFFTDKSARSNYDFTTLGSLPAALTLTRSTSALYYNSVGTLTSAGVNAARFDYDPTTLTPKGLLMEAAGTNIAQNSEAFTSWGTNAVTVACAVGLAPDGNNTACKMTENSGAGSSTHQVASTYVDGNQILTKQYTVSFFAKAGTANSIFMTANDTPGNYSSIYAVLAGAGTITSSSGTTMINNGIQQLPSGWYRLWITMNAGNTSGQWVGLQIRITNSSWQDFYDAGTGGRYLYIWGAQQETASSPTSYIKTTTSNVVRGADTLTFSAGSLFNPYGGTLFAQYINAGSDSSATSHVLGFFGTNASSTFTQNAISLADSGVSNKSLINSGSVNQYNPAGSVAAAKSVNKLCLAYTTSSMAFSANGSAPSTQTTGTLPASTLTYGYIGSQPDGYMRSRWIQKIMYYNQRLNNPMIQQLTQ